MSGIGGGGSPGDFVDGAIQGLKEGVTSLAIDYVSKELDLDPLLANAIVLAAGGAINGLQEGDILQGIVDAYEDALINAVSFGLAKRDPVTGEIIIADMSSWQEAAYISRVMDIADSLKTNGLEQTLYDYAVSTLHYQAVNEFSRPSGVYDIIGEQLGELGDVVFEIIDSIGGSKEIVNSETGETLGGYKEDGDTKVLETGEYEVDPETGKKKLVNGRRLETKGKISKTVEIENGGVRQVTRVDDENKTFIKVTGVDGNNIEYDENGKAKTYEVIVREDNGKTYGENVVEGKIVSPAPHKDGKSATDEVAYDEYYEEYKFIQEKLSEGWENESPQPPNPPDNGGEVNWPSWETYIAQLLWDWGFIKNHDDYFRISTGMETNRAISLPVLVNEWGLLNENAIQSIF